MSVFVRLVCRAVVQLHGSLLIPNETRLLSRCGSDEVELRSRRAATVECSTDVTVTFPRPSLVCCVVRSRRVGYFCPARSDLSRIDALVNTINTKNPFHFFQHAHTQRLF